jgi:predicted  nucleic acid-binding Zn-ribbon protein
VEQAFKTVRKLVEDFKGNEPHDPIVNLVERMLWAKEELSKAKTEAETSRLERECETLDRQIDQAVYGLEVYPAKGGRLTPARRNEV